MKEARHEGKRGTSYVDLVQRALSSLPDRCAQMAARCSMWRLDTGGAHAVCSAGYRLLASFLRALHEHAAA